MHKVPIFVAAVLLSLMTLLAHPSEAAPALQLPWPLGVQHLINGGNTYGCGTHSDPAVNKYAIDFQFADGDAVASVAGGTVRDGSQFDNDARGIFLDIDIGGGLRVRYLHLSSWAVGIGINSQVAQGQTIASSGHTGGVPAHLHIDMRLNGSAVKMERMSNIGGFGQLSFGYYGFSTESGLDPPSKGCSDSGPGCTQSTCGNIHDPSPSWTAQASSWNGWIGLGLVADGSPVAISYSDTRSDSTWAVKRSGSDIYEHHWGPQGWTSWTNISSGSSDPAFNGNVAVSNRYDKVTVIAMANNLMYAKIRTGSTWSSWIDISHSGPITGAISVSNGPNGRVDVVGVASNTLWWQYFNGSQWIGWSDKSNGSPITGDVAVANRGSYVHVVGVASNQVWLKWWNYDGSQVNGFFGVDGFISGSLAVDNMNATPTDPSCPKCGVDIVAMAGTNAWLRCWDVDCSTGWTGLGGPLTGPLTISNENLQLHIDGSYGGYLWLKWWG